MRDCHEVGHCLKYREAVTWAEQVTYHGDYAFSSVTNEQQMRAVKEASEGRIEFMAPKREFNAWV